MTETYRITRFRNVILRFRKCNHTITRAETGVSFNGKVVRFRCIRIDGNMSLSHDSVIGNTCLPLRFRKKERAPPPNKSQTPSPRACSQASLERDDHRTLSCGTTAQHNNTLSSNLSRRRIPSMNKFIRQSCGRGVTFKGYISWAFGSRFR